MLTGPLIVLRLYDIVMLTGSLIVLRLYDIVMLTWSFNSSQAV
jgi:hypothetical protein